MRVITEKLMNEFKFYLYEEEKSDNTIEKYMRDVRFFAAWSHGCEINKSLVLEYKNKLCNEYAPRSTNSILSSLNSFFIYMKWYDLKVKFLKIQKRIFADKERELSKSEYKRLLAASKQKRNEKLYYLMQTLGSTGIRISELRYITCDAVKSGQTTINCKGKIRQIFLPHDLCCKLKKYIARQNIKSGAVFQTKKGQPLSRGIVWKMMKKICSSAGVPEKKVFPHNFRHLFARTFYSIQKDIVRLADILGHSSIETTRIYTIESGDVHMMQIQKLGLLSV